ncbi:hypothetical protein F2P79_009377 [Pimephales promelas]|nr:hypothetical protein F2P79_009377 [Pimephales promelas]
MLLTAAYHFSYELKKQLAVYYWHANAKCNPRRQIYGHVRPRSIFLKRERGIQLFKVMTKAWRSHD